MDSLVIGSKLHERYKICELKRKNVWVNHYIAETGTERVYIKEIFESNLFSLDHRETQREKFRGYLERLLKLNNPRIMKVIEFFQERDRHYCISEWVPGINLSQLAITWESKDEDIIKVATEICEALSSLHPMSRPVILRSLCPDDIIVTPEKNIKIIDLGITSFFIPLERRKFIIKQWGSPGYAAPEEYSNCKIDMRADIYSFGALLYFLYTRQTPPESIDILMGVETLTLPSKMRRNINEKVEKIILKAMSLDKRDRYESIIQIGKELKEATSKTWSSVHLHPKAGKPEKAQKELALEDVPNVEPYMPQEEWIIDKFKKNELGCTTPLGIDFGSDCIKISSLERSGSGFNITFVAQLPTPLGYVVDGTIREPQKLAALIKEWLENKEFSLLPPPRQGLIDKLYASAGLGRRNCVVMMGGPGLLIRGFETDTNDLREVKYQAHLNLSEKMSVDDMKIDTLFVRQQKKKNKVLTLAISNKSLEKVREVAQLLNLNIKAIEFEPIALFRSLFLILGGESLTKTVAVLNIGADYSSLNFCGKGTLRHARVIQMGGSHITMRLSDALSVSFNKAERIKREHIIIPQDGGREFPTKLSSELFAIIEPQLSEFAKEMSRTFNYFNRMYEERNVELLLITGGGALFQNFDRYLSKKLETAVVIGSVFRNIAWSNILDGNPKNLEKEFARYTVSMGLASFEMIKKK